MPRTIGILGGMGPRATHYFVERLLREVEDTARPACDQEYPDLHVHFACSNPDRTGAVLANDNGRLRHLLLRQLRALTHRGCDTLVVPCVSAHGILDPIPDDVPVWDLRRIAFDYVASVAGAYASVGLLGTRATNLSMRGGASSMAHGMNVRLLEGRDEDRVMSVIYRDLKGGAASEATAATLLSLCAHLHEKGASHVIAGCTEIEMCLAACAGCPPYVVFPLRLAARRLVAHDALVPA